MSGRRPRPVGRDAGPNAARAPTPAQQTASERARSRPGLATRLLLPIGICLALATGLAGCAVHHLLANAIDSAIDTRLQARIAWLAGRIECDDGELEFDTHEARETGGLAESWQVELREGDAVVLWSSARALPAGSAARRLERAVSYQDARSEAAVLSAPTGSGAYRVTPGRLDLYLIAGTTTDGDFAVLHRADLILVSILPLFLLSSMALVAAIVRRETGPLTCMARTASAIDPEHLGAAPALAPAAQTDAASREVAELGMALDAMLARLATGLERERSFASAAAHELRTPLAQMLTNLEVSLRRERDAESYRVALRDALVDGQRLAGLVAAILALTRAQSAGSGCCDLDDLRVVCTTLGVVPQLQGPGHGKNCAGDPGTVAMILRNLIDNARRHGGGEPTVIITADPEQVSIAVADHGPGVPAAARERIFLPLVRLDEARTIDHAAGYGLGLAIVASAVAKLGGTVACTARPDGEPGAVFTVVLPVVG